MTTRKLVRHMLAQGYSIQSIVKATGLTDAEAMAMINAVNIQMTARAINEAVAFQLRSNFNSKGAMYH